MVTAVAIRVYDRLIDPRFDFRMHEQGLHFRGEGDTTGLYRSMKQRLFAEAISRDKYLAAILVEYHESEHAIQSGDAICPPVSVARQQHLCIAGGLKHRTLSAQVRAQLNVVIYLTIEYD